MNYDLDEKIVNYFVDYNDDTPSLSVHLQPQ